MKILFTADLHGNEKQYIKIFKKAKQENIDLLIFGGDLTPKDRVNRNIADQRKFLKQKVFTLTRKRFEKTGNKTFLILGNDDFKANQIYLEQESKANNFEIFHNKVLALNNINLIGYSYVPITPFSFKDWEKADLNDEQESTYLSNFITQGITTENGIIENKTVDLVERKDTIEKDMNNLFNKINNKEIIFVSHSPPHNTNVDQIFNGEHVGSKAINKAIRKYQPNYSLHGHIHETVELSGNYIDTLGKTVVLTPGNNHLGENVAVIIMDTENKKYIREIV